MSARALRGGWGAQWTRDGNREPTNRGAFRIQATLLPRDGRADHCGGSVRRSLRRADARRPRSGARMLDWPGEPTRDALPLRLIGRAARAGAGRAPMPSWPHVRRRGCDDDRGAVRCGRVLREHDAALLPWLDGPPQTNEAGRSAALMLGLLRDRAAARAAHRAARDRVERGAEPADRPLSLRPGRDDGRAGGRAGDDPARLARRPPPDVRRSRSCRCAGVDIAPMDADRSRRSAARLPAYVWADAADAAGAAARETIAMLREHGVRAGRGRRRRLGRGAAGRAAGRGRDARADAFGGVAVSAARAVAERIRAAMAAAGARATARTPARLGDDGARPRPYRMRSACAAGRASGRWSWSRCRMRMGRGSRGWRRRRPRTV